jgi:hypothetical protein
MEIYTVKFDKHTFHKLVEIFQLIVLTTAQRSVYAGRHSEITNSSQNVTDTAEIYKV